MIILVCWCWHLVPCTVVPKYNLTVLLACLKTLRLSLWLWCSVQQLHQMLHGFPSNCYVFYFKLQCVHAFIVLIFFCWCLGFCVVHAQLFRGENAVKHAVSISHVRYQKICRGAICAEWLWSDCWLAVFFLYYYWKKYLKKIPSDWDQNHWRRKKFMVGFFFFYLKLFFTSHQHCNIFPFYSVNAVSQWWIDTFLH